MTPQEKNELIEKAFGKDKTIYKADAAQLIMQLRGIEPVSFDTVDTFNHIFSTELKDYPPSISKAQIKKIAGIRNPRGAGRKSTQPPKKILVISATDEEITFIREHTTTRERAQIILAELM